MKMDAIQKRLSAINHGAKTLVNISVEPVNYKARPVNGWSVCADYPEVFLWRTKALAIKHAKMLRAEMLERPCDFDRTISVARLGVDKLSLADLVGHNALIIDNRDKG
jgi:hypothetical protein